VDWGSGPEAPWRRQHDDGVLWRPGSFSEERAHRAMDWGDQEETAEWVYTELKRKRPPQGGLPALTPLTECFPRDQSSSWQQLRSRMLQRPEARREQWDGLKEATPACSMVASASSPALLESQESPPTPPPVTDPALTPAPAPAPGSAYVPATAAASHPAMAEPPRVSPSPPAAKRGSRAAATTGMAFSVTRVAPKVLRGPRVNAAVAYVGRSSPVNPAGGSVPRKAPRSGATAAFGDFSAMRDGSAKSKLLPWQPPARLDLARSLSFRLL
jgi:hypothetical protein